MKPLNPAVARRIVALDDAKAQLADLEAALKIAADAASRTLPSSASCNYAERPTTGDA